MFFYIPPSFIGAGAPCPPRSMKAYIGTKEDILVSLCLSFSFPFSFSFLSFPFLPSFFFFFAEEGGGPGTPGLPPGSAPGKDVSSVTINKQAADSAQPADFEKCM